MVGGQHEGDADLARAGDAGAGLRLLTSYPKSGNTWLRALLQAWATGAVDINRLPDTRGIADRVLLAGMLDCDPGDLTVAELQAARPDLARRLATAPGRAPWYKCHDAYLPAPGASVLPFPLETLAGVVLIVRDPRDVACSLAAHLGVDLDRAIAILADPHRHVGLSETGSATLPQFQSSWSAFQQSWLDATEVPCIVLRYEDMTRDAALALERVLTFFALPIDAGAIASAVEKCRFEALAAQETRHDFRERLSRNVRFFRRGAAGGWRDALSAHQAARVSDDHCEMMRRFGYV